ncbi:MAG: hypothetical protein L0H12_04185, partial [Nitrosospira sp.]|nr:hypothetical protein [Nitrosospira sp.]
MLCNYSDREREQGVIIKTWKAFSYKAATYPLDHLSAFEWEFIQAAKGDKEPRTYRFVIEFGLHCFTRGLNIHAGKELHHIDRDLYYSDSRETRIFSFVRYELSFNLPDIAKSVDGRPCYHTGRGNFFVIDLLGSNEEKVEYEVYFQISRERRG